MLFESTAHTTGAVLGVRARSRISADLEARWFLLQVRVEGPRVKGWIDGEPAAEFDQLPKELLGAGRIGLQIHSDKASVEFRDLRVRRLSFDLFFD